MKNGINKWHIGIFLGSMLFMGFSFLFLYYGRINSDEGWYLYASRLVFEGKKPYQDFAFTQMPLLPYIYGIPQNLLGQSLWLGRITSILFSFINFGCCVFISKRYSGNMAGGVTALLFGAFTQGIYFSSIVKTYSLLSLLFTLTLVALSARSHSDKKYSFAVFFALLATLVRLSAVTFTVLIVLFSLYKTKVTKHKLFIGFSCIITIVIILFMVQPNIQAAYWNLLGHHLGQWEDLSLWSRLREIISNRAPLFITYFFYYFLLGGIIILFSIPHRRKVVSYFRRHVELLVIMFGLFMFMCTHFLTGGFYTEYFVPGVFTLLPIFGISFTKLSSQTKETRLARVTLRVVFIATLIFSFVLLGYVEVSGEQPPLQEVKELSSFIAEKTEPSDNLLLLETLYLAVDAERTVLPGLSMAHFSLVHLGNSEATNLKLVNGSIIQQYIVDQKAKIIVLSNLDWSLLQQYKSITEIRNSLAAYYDLAFTRDNFGQHNNILYIYTLKDQ